MSDGPSPPLSPEDFQRTTGVSRETLSRLEAYLQLLQKWQQAINLVGRSTLADPWRRHVLDSAQLLSHMPAGTESLLDLGSGAGFPGAVLAILGVADVHLVEADTRKAAFLQEITRITATRMTIHALRLDRLEPFTADVITARAFATVDEILKNSKPFRGMSTRYLLLKGEALEAELTQARKQWSMAATVIPSRTSATGRVLIIEGVEHHDRSR